MSQNQKTTMLKVVPVMFCFFAMGFVDLVGIASNYVKEDLGLSDAVANFLPSLVFVWFLVFSIPTSVLMNKIGRKKTVLLSLLVTIVSLVVPFIPVSSNDAEFYVMLAAFSLLGIGNALMQTSLNPLIAAVMGGGGNLASTLTFGQFVKAIASFIAPYLAAWGATAVIPSFGMGWKVLFVIFFVVGVLATLLLFVTPIEEKIVRDENEPSVWEQFVGALRLLGNPVILICFIGIMCHVGIDVGTNTTAPKILMERLGMALNDAAFATSLYFIFRTIGCFTGSVLLQIMKNKTFFALSALMLVLAMVGLAVGTSKVVLYTAIALVGYGNSNLFSIVLSQALGEMPNKQNEVSGLMIMGLCGGTVFPFFMGLASTAIGQIGAVLVMSVGVLYVVYLATKIK